MCRSPLENLVNLHMMGNFQKSTLPSYYGKRMPCSFLTEVCLTGCLGRIGGGLQMVTLELIFLFDLFNTNHIKILNEI